jgi:hypothetical protein
VTVVNAANRTGTTTSTGADRPNQVASINASGQSITNWFNKSAFAPPTLWSLLEQFHTKTYKTMFEVRN